MVACLSELWIQNAIGSHCFHLKNYSHFTKKHRTSLVIHTWKLIEQGSFFFYFFSLPFTSNSFWVRIAQYPKFSSNMDAWVEVTVKSLLFFSPVSSWTKTGKGLCKHTVQAAAVVWGWPVTLTFNAKIQQVTKTTSEVSNPWLQPWIHCKICSSVGFFFSTIATLVILSLYFWLWWDWLIINLHQFLKEDITFLYTYGIITPVGKDVMSEAKCYYSFKDYCFKRSAGPWSRFQILLMS